MKRFYLHILFVLGIFLLNYIISFSQDIDKIDSLNKQLNLTSNDSIKIDLYQKLFWECRRSDLETALEFANKALELSTSVNDARTMAMSKYMKGIIKKDQGQFIESAELLQKAKSGFQTFNDTIRIVSCLSDLANLYIQQDEYKMALGFLEEAINLLILTHDNIKLGRIYNMIGSLFLAQNQFDKALEYYAKSLDLNEKENFKLGMSVNYNNMGSGC